MKHGSGEEAWSLPHERLGVLCGVVLAGLVLTDARLAAAPVTATYTYPSSVTSDAGGPLDLKAELNYDDARQNAPIAVVMHGYSGSSGKLGEVRDNARRLRDKGFFAVSVAMRGRDGSDGVRDSGGLEIYDIYDAVEAVKRDYPDRVDPTTVYLTGYSGGGGNTMAAVCKFPNAFNAAAAFFGMSDYGYDAVNGWYFKGASSSHQTQLRTDIGDPTGGVAGVRDRYHARASNLASANNPYTEIHLFVNANETTCPPVNALSFRDNAAAQESFPGEFTNITVHIGQSGLYHDFNTNGVNDADERQWWPHGAPTPDQQDAAEAWFMDRLLAGLLPRRPLNEADRLFVAGFVKTSRFECRAGDGQQGMVQLDYALAESNLTFHAEVLSLDKQLVSQLTVDTAAFTNRTVEVIVNGAPAGSFNGGGPWTCAALRHGDTLELRRAGPAVHRRPKLLAYYAFENTLNDATTNVFHGASGTSGGAGVTFTNTASAALAPRSAACAAFDGKSWAALPFLDLYGRARSGGITVSFWVKGVPPAGSNGRWVLAEGRAAATGPAYCFGHKEGASLFRVYVRSDSSSVLRDRESAAAAFDGAWHHVVWTDHAGAASLSIDGARTDCSYIPGSVTLDTTTVGAYIRGPSDTKYPFTGVIDDLSVWDEALDADSVAALAAGLSPLKLAGLLSDPVLPVPFVGCLLTIE
jgi:dienelactone hydrolase